MGQFGPDKRPYIVAEMSGNHNGSLDRALALVDAAADAGADAIKIQTYTADTMTVDVKHPRFQISKGHDLWSGEYLYQLFERAHTPWEWHEAIFERARGRGASRRSPARSTGPRSSCWRSWTRRCTRSRPRRSPTCR